MLISRFTRLVSRLVVLYQTMAKSIKKVINNYGEVTSYFHLLQLRLLLLLLELVSSFSSSHVGLKMDNQSDDL